MKKYIQLKPEIKQQINDFVQTQNLDKDSLGLHIRATDKNYRGSLKSLIKSIDRFSDHKNIKKIFLCTDNKNVEKEMIDYFTNKVVIYPKIRPENNVPLHYWAKNSNNDELKIQAAKEAVFDMFILSKTEYVLSQFGSTFSEISRVYHNEKSKENYWQIFQYIGII